MAETLTPGGPMEFPGTALVRRHPGRAAVALAALVVVLLVLWGYSAYYRGKSGFRGNVTPGNFTITGMSPLWQMGAEDAGMYGAVGRAPTQTNLAAIAPNLRLGARAMAARQSASRLSASRGGAPEGPNASAYLQGMGPRALAARGRREGLDAQCGPGQVAVTSAGPDGTTMTTCTARPDVAPQMADDDAGVLGPFDPAADCGEWDPEATVEVQALAGVGGIAGPPYGESPLRSAIDMASDTTMGLTSSTLKSMAGYTGAV